MKLSTSYVADGIAIVAIRGPITSAAIVHILQSEIERLSALGRRGVLLDLQEVSRVNFAGLAGLVELVARNSKLDLAFSGLPAPLKQKLENNGLDRSLAIFSDVDAALAAPMFTPHRLSLTPSLILCQSSWPKTSNMPKSLQPALLDVLGQRAIERVLTQASKFGLRQSFFDLGDEGESIARHINSLPKPDQSVFFLPLTGAGTLAALRKLAEIPGQVTTDLVVINGDKISNVDLAALVADHQHKQSHLTIAHGAADSLKLDEAAAFALSPEVLTDLAKSADLTLEPALAKLGVEAQKFGSQVQSVVVSTPESYHNGLQACLFDWVDWIDPKAKNVGPSQWRDESVCISRRAKVDGAYYLGSNVQLAQNVRLTGTSIISDGADLGAGCELHDSIVLPGSRIERGTVAAGKILFTGGAIALSKAQNKPTGSMAA